MKIIELDNVEIEFLKKCVNDRLKYTTDFLNTPDEKVSKTNHNFYIVPLKSLLDKLDRNTLEINSDETRKIVSCMNEQKSIFEQSEIKQIEQINLINSILDKCSITKTKK